MDKGPGDEVSSGTVNQFGSFDMKAAKVGEDSSIQRMIRLVQSADAGKAKIVGLADRWATWIVVIALSAAALTWLITGEIIRAVTILVVFCPCALVLATPTAIMAAIGNATQHGFLVREGDALERLARVSKVAFDKTGTLTYRHAPRSPPWTQSCRNCPAQAALPPTPPARSRARSIPWGRRWYAAARKETRRTVFPQPENFQMLPGRGVRARGGGQSRSWRETGSCSQEQGIPCRAAGLERRGAAISDRGCTVIYLAVDGALAGFLALSDTLRPGRSAI